MLGHLPLASGPACCLFAEQKGWQKQHCTMDKSGSTELETIIQQSEGKGHIDTTKTPLDQQGQKDYIVDAKEDRSLYTHVHRTACQTADRLFGALGRDQV